MNKKLKQNIIIVLITLLITFIVMIPYFVSQGGIGEFELYFVPRQYEQVEVIETRIEPRRSADLPDTYIVVFEFPDGSIKEFRILGFNRRRTLNSMHAGDVGILTFREQSNIDEITSAVSRRHARRFISFEPLLAE